MAGTQTGTLTRHNDEINQSVLIQKGWPISTVGTSKPLLRDVRSQVGASGTEDHQCRTVNVKSVVFEMEKMAWKYPLLDQTEQQKGLGTRTHRSGNAPENTGVKSRRAVGERRLSG